MTTQSLELLIFILVLLLGMAVFFSAAETGMMSLNRYRLRHLVRKGNPIAKRIALLLERPDRLLSVILLGSTFANISASAVATVIATHYFGDVGIILETFILTLVVLIFAETAPKTLAALYPMRVAFLTSLPLKILLKVLYPLVWLVNSTANATLALFRIQVRKGALDPLTVDELRTIVHEATGKISASYQMMLLRILDLEKMTVADVMIPRNEIIGIDLQDDWKIIEGELAQSEHSWLPLYRENIDRVEGMLNVRQVLSLLRVEDLSKTKLQKLAQETYFVPESALLNRQLLNFQEQQKSVALVVDEYGGIEGLVTLRDVLEEIVGEFAKDSDQAMELIQKQKDGSYVVDGGVTIRDLVHLIHWQLPVDGPRTLGGLIIEHLEMIPTEGVGARVCGYPMEIFEMRGNRIKKVRVFPKLYRAP